MPQTINNSNANIKQFNKNSNGVCSDISKATIISAMKRRELTQEELAENARLKAIYEKRREESIANGKRITQADVADACGWANQSAFSQYASGRIPLNLEAILKLSEVLMFNVEDVSPRLASLLGAQSQSNTNSNVEYVKDANLIKQNVYKYPVISWVSAGLSCEAWQPEYIEEYMHTDINAGDNGFWLKVKGDSMTNTSGISFPDGVYILVNPSAEIYNENFIVAKLTDTNEATFKQYVEEAGIKYLKPLNSAYKMQELDERWQLVGKVVDARWRLG